MAFFDNSFTSTKVTLGQRLARMFDTPFDRRYRQRARKVEALRNLSDRELAARGIARDDILFHVFSGGS